MEVDFTPEQEAHLLQVARYEGTAPEHLVKNAAVRMLDDDTRFRAAVQRGIDQADRGEFIDEEEMDARFRRMLEP